MNRFLLAALAAACITAAGVGGYLATRSASTVAPTAVASSPAATPATTAAPAPAQPVAAAASPASVAARDADATTKSQPAPVAASSTPSASRTPAARAVAPPRSAAAPQSASNLRREVPLSQRIPPAAQAPSQPPAVQPIPADPAAFQPPPPPARPDDRAAEIARLSEPPTKTYEELIIAPDSVVGLQIERTISTTTARVEDRVDARVTRDVRVGEKIAIPSGTRAIGSVTEVEKGGKFKDRARLGIRFHTLVLPDGTREQIATETIYRDGDAPEGAQKVGGGAAVGAILGAILGGAKGAAVGAGVGGGAGAVATANGDKSAASFPAGTQTTVRVLSPITITIER